MTTGQQDRAEGFSLIELLVAMTVTLFVSGAIFGLLSGGQNAFRREPELTDRQQNIRVAINLIQNDVGTAGVGMGAFFQVFSDALDGVGPQGTTGLTDHLQIFGNDGTCPDAPADNVNKQGPTSGVNLNTLGPIPPCYSNDQFVLVIYQKDGLELGGKFGFGHNIHAGDMKINFPGGLLPDSAPGTTIDGPKDLESWDGNNTNSGTPIRMSMINIYRYEIANDPADGVPCLWRSGTGGFQLGGGAYVAAPDPDGQWQMVARGIEDLQVQYRRTGAGWGDTPGVPVPNDFNTVVREIRVTLSSRSAAPNLTGQTTAANAAIGAGAVNAVRGSITSTMAPRATLYYVSQASPNPTWQ